MDTSRINSLVSNTLWDLKTGHEAVIDSLSHDIPEPYRRRLRELGFHGEETIVCVKRTLAGAPRLYRISHCIYSLEKSVAKLIKIRSKQKS